MTPHTDSASSTDSPPDEVAWVTRHWKAVATMATVLTSAGYLVVSPSARIERVAAEIQHATEVQTVKNAAQDERIDRLQALTDDGLRDLREDVRDLILAQCLKAPEVIVRARLKCSSRLNGER